MAERVDALRNFTGVVPCCLAENRVSATVEPFAHRGEISSRAGGSVVLGAYKRLLQGCGGVFIIAVCGLCCLVA